MGSGMIGFICGCVAGGFFGFFFCGLLVTLSNDQKGRKR